MSSVAAQDVERAARLAGAMVFAAGLVAIAVRLVAAAAARSWLDFSFGGIPDRFDEVVIVFTNNARLLAGILAACVVGQLAVRTRAGGTRVLVGACDALVVVSCLVHVVLVGLTVGAYGERGISALLPHGPLELGAFSLALSLYVSSRRETLSLRRALSIAVVAAVGLAVSAVVEVMA